MCNGNIFKKRLAYINVRITALAKRGDYEGDQGATYYRSLVLHRALLLQRGISHEYT